MALRAAAADGAIVKLAHAGQKVCHRGTRHGHKGASVDEDGHNVKRVGDRRRTEQKRKHNRCVEQERDDKCEPTPGPAKSERADVHEVSDEEAEHSAVEILWSSNDEISGARPHEPC